MITKDKKLYLLLLIAFLVHLAAVLFIYYSKFSPFAGGVGDFDVYNKTAVFMAQRFKQGNFSLEGLCIPHYFPIVIGILYTFTFPAMLTGQLFTVLLAVISLLFVYLIVLELSSSKKWAFLIGLVVCFYPSYVYFGSLLLKDTLVIPLVLAGLLLSIKMLKKFSWKNFLIFYIILTCSTHFRFYVGYALLFSFIICWFIVSSLAPQKRVIYGIVIVLLLGFSPQILGYGYYGKQTLKDYLTPGVITSYREVVYAPQAPEISEPGSGSPSSGFVSSSGMGSSFSVKTELEKPVNFVINYSKSFIYTLLGPFPWQIKHKRQFFALFETIPWYFLFSIIVLSIIKSIKTKRIRFAMPLLVFAILSLGALSLFVTNYGVIFRIRILSFIALLCLIPLSSLAPKREELSSLN